MHRLLICLMAAYPRMFLTFSDKTGQKQHHFFVFTVPTNFNININTHTHLNHTHIKATVTGLKCETCIYLTALDTEA